MQQGRHQGLGIEFPFRALGGHGDRVRDIGFTTVAELAQMRLIGESIGHANLFQIGCGQVVKFGGQAGETGRRRIGSSRTGLDWRTTIRPRSSGFVEG